VLLIVDVQLDFCTGGTLAVPGSERVVVALNSHIARAVARDLAIYASRDWHPAVSEHFKAYGGSWPVHCVQGTEGASFHPDLLLPSGTIVVSKGARPDSHGYSAFEGVTPQGTPLGQDLSRREVSHLYVGGLATDYCVKHSVLDAVAAGLDVTVLADAIAGVDVSPGDSARALDEMRARGAVIGRL
jgi:nicotinamidase/pyrazinamidase